ncbi:MAG: NUDIX domain-containing protein [Candidatus Bathyarchaeota archaeon]
MKEQRYCRFCGKELIPKILLDGSKERYCSACNYVFFSTPSPAVIVMVASKNRILLARGVGWKHPYWGLISGHIKRDETAEQTAIREVQEEVGLEISNLKILKTCVAGDYGLLMIAFKAKTRGMIIKKSKELEEAKWFDINKPLPLRSTSIAANVVKHVYPRTKLANREEN